MSTESQESSGSALAGVSNAMVALHKQQFGRGPLQSRAAYAGDDVIVVTMRGGLLPAERAMNDMGQYARVQEFRSYYQDATRQLFIEVVEELVGRQVMAFASATDARAEVIWEIFEFGAPTEPG